jgi:cytochrome c6
MKKNLVVLILCAAIVALSIPTIASADDAGAATYAAKCAMCHGKTGAGDGTMGKNMKIRDFASADVQKQSDADLTGIITKGKNKMPKYEGKLSADQVKQVVAFIRSLAKK